MPLFKLNIPGIDARELRENHLDDILGLMNKEGWYYYDQHELRRYLALNQDCFVVLDDDRVIGSLFTTNYGNQVWIGNIVIAQEYRGRGLAFSLIEQVIDYLHHNRHVSTFRLGSVPLAIGLYKKVGFKPESFTTAQQVDLPIQLTPGVVQLPTDLSIQPLTEDDLSSVAQVDAKFFKSRRLPILRELYHNSVPGSCLTLKNEYSIVGFIMIRRRQKSKLEGGFAEGPDHVYRLGPCIVLPEYGFAGFRALFEAAIQAVNEDVQRLEGDAKLYVVFPRNSQQDDIYKDTSTLAAEFGMDVDLDAVFDQHGEIFAAEPSAKNTAQWNYLAELGFQQEYFEQVMSYTIGGQAELTQADPEGIFASATPGDKA